jgi:hypothetical protein
MTVRFPAAGAYEAPAVSLLKLFEHITENEAPSPDTC